MILSTQSSDRVQLNWGFLDGMMYVEGFLIIVYFEDLRFKPPGYWILQGGMNEKLNMPGFNLYP